MQIVTSPARSKLVDVHAAVLTNGSGSVTLNPVRVTAPVLTNVNL